MGICRYAGSACGYCNVCIYAMYDRKQIDKLINAYFTEGCPKEIRIKIYCYIAACGLLWSNWCEYKRNLGIDLVNILSDSTDTQKIITM